MGWLSDVTADATVVVSKSRRKRAALRFDDGTVFCNIDVVEHSTVTEYRGLTEACANDFADSIEVGTRSSISVSITDADSNVHKTVVSDVIGTELLVSVSRANEAGAHTVTVEEVTAAGPTSISVTGAGTDIKSNDVTYSYGHSR